MKQRRIYKGKKVEMLTACATIMENSLANQAFLVSKRQVWAPPYFDNLKKRIDDAFNTIIGADNALTLRRATNTVINIYDDSILALAEFKVQLVEDYKNDKPRRDQLLQTFGLNRLFKTGRSKDQEGLIEILFKFKTNMTPALRNELTAKGISAELIERIESYADKLSAANITQETIKGQRKSNTAVDSTELNAIYDEVIAIAKIARTFYRGDAIKRDKFSYTKILKTMNAPIARAKS